MVIQNLMVYHYSLNKPTKENASRNAFHIAEVVAEQDYSWSWIGMLFLIISNNSFYCTITRFLILVINMNQGLIFNSLVLSQDMCCSHNSFRSDDICSYTQNPTFPSLHLWLSAQFLFNPFLRTAPLR